MEFLGRISTDEDLATKGYVDSKIVYLNGGVKTVDNYTKDDYPVSNGTTFYNTSTNPTKNGIWTCANGIWTISRPVTGVIYVDTLSNKGEAYLSDCKVASGTNPYGARLIKANDYYDNSTSGLSATTNQQAIDVLATKVATNTSAISSLGNISEYKVIRGTATTNPAGVATLDYSAAGFTEKPFIMAGGIFMTHLSSSFFKGITIQSDALYTTTSCGVFLLTGTASNSALGANKTFDWIAIGK